MGGWRVPEISSNSSRDEIQGAKGQRIPFQGKETAASLQLALASCESSRAVSSVAGIPDNDQPMTGKFRSLPEGGGRGRRASVLGGIVLLETRRTEHADERRFWAEAEDGDRRLLRFGFSVTVIGVLKEGLRDCG